MITMQQIEIGSPKVMGSWDPDRPDAKDFPMAFYSVNCCWWTSFPSDLGKLPPQKYENGKIIPNPGGPQLPCCPYCGSVLMQAPLDKFLEEARKNPKHYGPDGLIAFVASHHRSGFRCRKKFEDYR